jgi:DNA transformation protein
MADTSTRDNLLARLEGLDVQARAAFGGWLLYLDGRYFGLVSGDGRIYFRTDEASRAEYTSRGMPAFHPGTRPRGPKTVDRNFEVPPDVLKDSALLAEWAERASWVKR